MHPKTHRIKKAEDLKNRRAMSGIGRPASFANNQQLDGEITGSSLAPPQPQPFADLKPHYSHYCSGKSVCLWGHFGRKGRVEFQKAPGDV